MNDFETVRKEVLRRNRISFSRMFLQRGEPYTLRKYKMIFKREMEDRPELYDVLDANGEPKEDIVGILGEDERFEANYVTFDKKFEK